MSEFGDLRRTWDATAENDLRRMWPRPEHSARTIGKLLGFSRNAIIAKAHRLGLALNGKKLTVYSRHNPSEPRSYKSTKRNLIPRQPASQAATGWKPKPIPLPQWQDTPPSPRNVSLVDLQADQCRWPLWDQTSTSGPFCGSDTHGEHPYCSHHCKMAYPKMRVG